MKFSFTTLDVFTSTPYAGNPLAVINLPASSKDLLTQSQKQKIATEFNLSEIIFLHETSSDESTVDIFTTVAEIPFAGHPTIGAAYYLLHLKKQPTTVLVEKAGRIPVEVDIVTGGVKAEVPHDFHLHKVAFQSELTEVAVPVVSIVNGMSFILVPLPDLPTLAKASRNLQPTYDPSPLDKGWQSGLIGTMYFVSQGVDEFGRRVYRTRMFADEMEDPGTGSASCALGCWLALRGGLENNGEEVDRFAFVQGVEMGRRNEISVEVSKDDEGSGIAKCVLSGTAVKVMEGTLEI